jgi:hypothetical protein
MTFPNADTAMLREYMKQLGGSAEYESLDYLSPGDVARFALFRAAAANPALDESTRRVAENAACEILRVAEQRMAAVPAPQKSDLEVIKDRSLVGLGCRWLLSFDGHNPDEDQYVQCVDQESAFKLKALVEAHVERVWSGAGQHRWSLSEIKAAFLRAEETGRPEGARKRSEDDLENSWSHLRGALTGERV